MNVAVIPARLASTRFPRKVLAPLCGKPLIQWVWEGVRGAKTIARVAIATDAEEIADAARGFGAEVVLTDPELPSGTDRVAKAVEQLGWEDANWIVNVQGDEPLITGDVLDLLVGKLNEVGASFEMGTLARPLDPADLHNPNVVKVVTALSGRALYFSRAAIPFCRDPAQAGTAAYWHHLGIYAYRPEVLERLVGLPPSELEQVEKLEQLRALQHEVALKVIPTTFRSVGVDTPEDLEKVEGIVTARGASPVR